LVEFPRVQFPKYKTQQLRRMQTVALLPFQTGNYELLQILENLFNLQPIRGNRGEQVKVSPMRVGEFHHDKRVELDVKLEPS
jgi:hypothetical protein